MSFIISSPTPRVNNQAPALAAGEVDLIKKKRNLEGEAEETGHDRREKLRDLLHQSLCSLIKVAVFCIGILSFCWFLHLILPDKCHWLSDNQLENIRNILFSGILGGVISEYLKKNT